MKTKSKPLDKTPSAHSENARVVTICGSSRFIDIMAVCAWLIEKNEGAMVLGLHLLPDWYVKVPDDHLAEHEGVAEQMDALHLQKIDLSDEIFVVNFNYYIGNSTHSEIAYGERASKPVRYFMRDKVGVEVMEMMIGSRRWTAE